MVLLKNEKDTLPLQNGTKVALFGKGTVDYVKGGGGSGDVTVEYIRNLYEGMKIKEDEGKVEVFDKLAKYYEEDIQKQYADGAVPGMTIEPELPDDLLKEAREYTDTAIITICRFSGEGWDRKCEAAQDGYVLDGDEKRNADLSAKIFEDGDFCLTNAENAMVEKVKKAFPHVIVVMNVGGIVDTKWFKDCEEIQSVLMAWQGGMEGGNAVADLLSGKVSPSGKLTDTIAHSLSDYPAANDFGDTVRNFYTEDIYVGYRYFETFCPEKVMYEFGYGISYTTFEIEILKAETVAEEGNRKDELTKSDAGDADHAVVKITAIVKNTGNAKGKEVVQVYVEAPQGKLGKPARELKAFAKTKELAPGESQQLVLTIPVKNLASYDDSGVTGHKSCYVLEAGAYVFHVGNSVRNTQITDVDAKGAYEVKELCVTEALQEALAPTEHFERIRPEQKKEGGTYQIARENVPQQTISLEERIRKHLPQELTITGDQGIRFSDVADGKETLEAFIAQLEKEELATIVRGEGMSSPKVTPGTASVTVFMRMESRLHAVQMVLPVSVWKMEVLHPSFQSEHCLHVLLTFQWWRSYMSWKEKNCLQTR